MGDKIHFKLTHGGVTRRFALSRGEEDLLSVLKARVLTITGAATTELYWKDEDSLIVLECKEDMFAAVDYAETQNKLGCVVLATGEKAEMGGAEEEEKGEAKVVVTKEESMAAFNGSAVVCSACKGYLAPSNGGRFLCTICDNYDSCAACLEKGEHPNHAFVRLLNGDTEVPLPLSREVGGVISKKAKDSPDCAPIFVVAKSKFDQKTADPSCSDMNEWIRMNTETSVAKKEGICDAAMMEELIMMAANTNTEKRLRDVAMSEQLLGQGVSRKVEELCKRSMRNAEDVVKNEERKLAGRGYKLRPVDGVCERQKAANQLEVPLKISGSGAEAILPITTWEESGLDAGLLDNCINRCKMYLSPIHRLAFPAIQTGRDVLAHSATSSSKAAAFMLPIMHEILTSGRELRRGRVEAVFMAPTRDAAQEMMEQAIRLTRHENERIRIVCSIGQSGYRETMTKLMDVGANVLIATIGRLQDHLEQGHISLDSLRYFVMVDADRMLESKTTTRAMNDVFTHRRWPKMDNVQSLIFSATLPQAVVSQANMLLKQNFLVISATNGAKDRQNMSSVVFNFDGDVPLKLTGPDSDSIQPIGSWERSMLYHELIDICLNRYKVCLRSIHQLAIPAIQTGRDVLAESEVWSGKAAAFMLPLIDQMLTSSRYLSAGKVGAVILAPSREAAKELAEQALRLICDRNLRHIRVVCSQGAEGYRKTMAELRDNGTHILIATIGRLKEHVEQEHISLDSLRYFVMADADRMLDNRSSASAMDDIFRHRRWPQPGEMQSIIFSSTLSQTVMDKAHMMLQENFLMISADIGTIEKEEEKEKKDRQYSRNEMFGIKKEMEQNDSSTGKSAKQQKKEEKKQAKAERKEETRRDRDAWNEFGDRRQHGRFGDAAERRREAGDYRRGFGRPAYPPAVPQPGQAYPVPSNLLQNSIPCPYGQGFGGPAYPYQDPQYSQGFGAPATPQYGQGFGEAASHSVYNQDFGAPAYPPQEPRYSHGFGAPFQDSSASQYGHGFGAAASRSMYGQDSAPTQYDNRSVSGMYRDFERRDRDEDYGRGDGRQVRGFDGRRAPEEERRSSDRREANDAARRFGGEDVPNPRLFIVDSDEEDQEPVYSDDGHGDEEEEERNVSRDRVAQHHAMRPRVDPLAKPDRYEPTAAVLKDNPRAVHPFHQKEAARTRAEERKVKTEEKEADYNRASQMPAHLVIALLRELPLTRNEYGIYLSPQDIESRLNDYIRIVQTNIYALMPHPRVFAHGDDVELIGNIAVDLLKHLINIRKVFSTHGLNAFDNRIHDLGQALRENDAEGEEYVETEQRLQPILLSEFYTVRNGQANGIWDEEFVGFMEADPLRDYAAPPRVASADPAKEGLFAPVPKGCRGKAAAPAVDTKPAINTVTNETLLQELIATELFPQEQYYDQMVAVCSVASDLREAIEMMCSEEESKQRN